MDRLGRAGAPVDLLLDAFMPKPEATSCMSCADRPPKIDRLRLNLAHARPTNHNLSINDREGIHRIDSGAAANPRRIRLLSNVPLQEAVSAATIRSRLNPPVKACPC